MSPQHTQAEWSMMCFVMIAPGDDGTIVAAIDDSR
jgi:hypothetical protein